MLQSQHRAHLLLVESDQAQADLVLQALDCHTVRATVDHVRSGDEMLRYLQREDKYASAPRPDAILVDSAMPSIGGTGPVESIKSHPDLCGIPVIVMTSSDRAPDGAADGCIRKPVTGRDFEFVMDRIRPASRAA